MLGLRAVLYSVAVMSSLACTLLLFRGYARSRVRLLMWSAICFACLTVSNVALYLDLIVFPDLNLRLARLTPALIGVAFLLYGFIWDTD